MPLSKDSTDKEILDTSIGGQILRDMSGISFTGWVAGKINGLPAYKASVVELTALVKSPPLGRLPEEEKIKIVRKLIELEVPL